MEIVIRSALVFFLLWGLTRATGKRELSQLSAFELVLLVVIGDLVQQGVTQEDMSVTGAVLAVGTIGLLTVLLSTLGFRSGRARDVIGGLAIVVVRDGEVLEDALAYERITVADVREAARENGISTLDHVALCVLEPDGRFSFLTERAST